MDAPSSEFENASRWAGVAIANFWMPYAAGSQPIDDSSIFKGQIFGTKDDVVHAIKTFSIKTHQQYFVYKSSKALLTVDLPSAPVMDTSH